MPPHSWCAPEANTAVQLNYGGIFENGLAAGAAIHWLSPEDPVTFPPGKCKICALCSPGSPVIIQTNPTTLLRRSIWIIVPNAAVFVNAERGNFAMKKISVLGDSISTFSGYTTPDGVFYDLFAMAMAELRGVEDTWWMRVIRGLDGVLDVNDSFSSTTVSNSDRYTPAGTAAAITDRFHRSPNYLSGCSDHRTSHLGHPDIILIYMGTNDAGYGIPLHEFDRDYRLMLQKLRRNYPNAAIWCGTLLWSYCVKDEEITYYNAEVSAPLDGYNEIIRAAADAEGCHVADLAKSGVEYAAIDVAHPHADGMKTIADLWLRAMEETH